MVTKDKNTIKLACESKKTFLGSREEEVQRARCRRGSTSSSDELPWLLFISSVPRSLPVGPTKSLLILQENGCYSYITTSSRSPLPQPLSIPECAEQRVCPCTPFPEKPLRSWELPSLLGPTEIICTSLNIPEPVTVTKGMWYSDCLKGSWDQSEFPRSS